MLPVWEYILPAIRMDDKLLLARTPLPFELSFLRSAALSVCAIFVKRRKHRLLLSE